MHITLVVAALYVAMAGTGGDTTSAPASESRVWITGASNIRRFSCRAGGLTGRVQFQPNVARRSMLSGQNVSNAPSLRIPVAMLECGISAMNRHLRETLRASDYEAIEFHLDSYDVRVAGTPTARIAGRLRVAGAERPVVLTAGVAADSSGTLHVRGAYAVRMTDFGLRPPRRFAGLLRVHDVIVVHFDVVPGRATGVTDIAHNAPAGPVASHTNAGEAP